MPTETRIVGPGPNKNSVRTDNGQILSIPEGWSLLPPGDAGLTRRVKSKGPSWTIKQKKGRRTFSLGVLAPADRIENVQQELSVERSTDAYTKRRASDAKRREKKQAEYVEDFHGAVVQFLDFAVCHRHIAKRLAAAVAEHATPVGSGTVARTQRIPIARRAESAVIAWMRHQTTVYDNMKIPRVKGKRREVRRMLAEESKRLLKVYRTGTASIPEHCPLQRALKS